MISVASRFRAPASAMPSSSAALPPLTMSAPCHQTTPSSFTLPRLRIPHDAEAMTLRPSALYHSTGLHREEHESRENFTTTVSPAKPMGFAATSSPSEAVHPLFGANRSPLSPASFSQQPELKFGLAHLLEAAEHCHTIATSESTQSATRKRPLTTTQPPHSPSETHDPMAFTTQHLHSIDYLIHNPVENLRGAKRARPTLALDVPMYNEMPNVHPGYHVTQYEPSTPVYFDHTPEYPHMTPSGSRCESSSQSSSTRNVWETVLVTGDFPEDVCLSENPASTTKGSDQPSNPVKQGRWTNDEKEFAENLIQQVRNGEVMLPPNMSLRKFIAESLQCKAMRVSKKFRSLRSCQSPDGSSDGERSFNPLSLHSIMNEDATFDSFVDDEESSSPKRGSKTLKRSDYSQHGAVRSGRWSVEEENYAKAMIEAFKAGYLPLHGNVSLRKFLSEVLVCHPMRISKKFVGYVRKYHWYRIAAGKCDPDAKRRALEQLCVLEREFWASMQQNQEWTTIQQENRR